MKVSRITIGRLYNLGNYEHVRYELTVEIAEGESAATAVAGMESIIAGLSPLKSACIETEGEIKREASRIEQMRTMPAVEWDRHFGGYEGTPTEIIARHEQQLAEKIEKRNAALARAKRARELFDDLGGAAQWKDAKLDWQDYDYDEPV